MSAPLIAVLFLPVLALAQSAQVSGLICDPSGAALPDASIVLTKDDTGTRYTSRSSAQGYFFIPATLPGAYKIRVRKDGFQTVVQLGVQLAAGQNARIDFTLQLGVHEDSVEVTDRTSPVNTEDAAVGTVIGRGLIESLPLNGRGLLTLIETVPGVTVTPAGGGESGQFSAVGQRADSNYVTLDGISVNNGIGIIGLGGGRGSQLGGVVPVYTTLGTTQSFVSADAIEEFQVQVAGARAGLGRTAGAHVIMTSRTGSNQFHGSLADYVRNEALDANDWFAARGGQERSVFRMQDVSATLGGPIRRNRTFFFVSQESLRLDHPAIETQLVPTALARLSTPPGAQWLISGLPLPNGPETVAGLGLLTLAAPRTSQADSTAVRVDHTFASTVQLFARFSRAPSDDSLTNPGSLLATRVAVSSDSGTVGIDTGFGRSGHQSLRWNWTGIREDSSTWTQSLGHTVDLGQFLPSLADPSQTVYSLQILSPGISLITDNADGRQRQWNVVESASITRGRHTLAFGADYRALAPRLSSRPFMVTAVYPNVSTFATRTPLAITVSERNRVSLRLSNLSIFAEDTWRVSPRLVVNYGVRWEYNPAPGGSEGAPLFESVTPGNPPEVRVSPQGSALWSIGQGNFAPRLGIVERLDAEGKAVLRSSVGLFYEPGFASALAAAISQISTNVSLIGTVSGVSAIYSQFATADPASVSALASGFRMPYALEWNTSLDREIARGTTGSLAWVGSTGRRLLRLEQTDTAAGDSLTFYTNHGESSYQAMQAQVRSHVRQEIQVLAAFTWAHSIDNVSRDSDLFLQQPDWPGSVDRGNSSFDVRRSFSAAFTASPKAWRGWALDGIFRARSGFPLTVTALNSHLPFGLESRPDLVAGRPVWIRDANAPGGARLNPAAFAATSAAYPGSLGRNAIQGFGMYQLDLAVQREFRMRERFAVQIRAEAFNLLNHPNFGNPDTFMSDPTFGRALTMLNQFLGTGGPSTGLVPAFQIGGPRSLQLALRFKL